MTKTILLTGATDGIGLETAKLLSASGHHVLLHGRSQDKLDRTKQALLAVPGHGPVDAYLADLSNLDQVEQLAHAVREQHPSLDVLINNAGVYSTAQPRTPDGLDVRFVVNTLAPYLLTDRLLDCFPTGSRIVNLSSAAQATVDLDALKGHVPLSERAAYAQSKLAITMWSMALAEELSERELVVVAVNPASMLGSKMVQTAFGVQGGDIGIGARILVQAATDDSFANASGKYYDNDAKTFASPHPDGLDSGKRRDVVEAIKGLLGERLGHLS